MKGFFIVCGTILAVCVPVAVWHGDWQAAILFALMAILLKMHEDSA